MPKPQVVKGNKPREQQTARQYEMQRRPEDRLLGLSRLPTSALPRHTLIALCLLALVASIPFVVAATPSRMERRRIISLSYQDSDSDMLMAYGSHVLMHKHHSGYRASLVDMATSTHHVGQNRQVFQALENGDFTFLEDEISTLRLHPDARLGDAMSPNILSVAIKKRDIKTVKMLLEKGAKTRPYAVGVMTPLRLAIKECPECIPALVKSGANLEEIYQGHNLLEIAMLENPPAMQFLLDVGRDKFMQRSREAFELALTLKNPIVLQTIYQNRIVDVDKPRTLSAWHRLNTNPEVDEIISLEDLNTILDVMWPQQLAKNDELFKLYQFNSQQGIHEFVRQAVIVDNVEFVKKSLAHFNYREDYIKNNNQLESFRLISLAASFDAINIVEMLVKRNVKVDDLDDMMNTPLHTAAMSDTATGRMVNLLVQLGAKINAKNEFGQTPLHYAAVYNPTLIPELLRHHADPDATSITGLTPLLDVALVKPQNVYQVMKQGIKNVKFVKRASNHTVLHILTMQDMKLYKKALEDVYANRAADIRSALIAKEYKETKEGIEKSILAVLKAGADVNFRSIQGNSPFHTAVINQPAMIKSFIAYGADINSRDVDGYTALMRVIENENLSGAEELLAAGAAFDIKEVLEKCKPAATQQVLELLNKHIALRKERAKTLIERVWLPVTIVLAFMAFIAVAVAGYFSHRNRIIKRTHLARIDHSRLEILNQLTEQVFQNKWKLNTLNRHLELMLPVSCYTQQDLAIMQSKLKDCLKSYKAVISLQNDVQFNVAFEGDAIVDADKKVRDCNRDLRKIAADRSPTGRVADIKRRIASAKTQIESIKNELQEFKDSYHRIGARLARWLERIADDGLAENKNKNFQKLLTRAFPRLHMQIGEYESFHHLILKVEMQREQLLKQLTDVEDELSVDNSQENLKALEKTEAELALVHDVLQAHDKPLRDIRINTTSHSRFCTELEDEYQEMRDALLKPKTQQRDTASLVGELRQHSGLFDALSHAPAPLTPVTPKAESSRPVTALAPIPLAATPTSETVAANHTIFARKYKKREKHRGTFQLHFKSIVQAAHNLDSLLKLFANPNLRDQDNQELLIDGLLYYTIRMMKSRWSLSHIANQPEEQQRATARIRHALVHPVVIAQNQVLTKNAIFTSATQIREMVLDELIKMDNAMQVEIEKGEVDEETFSQDLLAIFEDLDFNELDILHHQPQRNALSPEQCCEEINQCFRRLMFIRKSITKPNDFKQQLHLAAAAKMNIVRIGEYLTILNETFPDLVLGAGLQTVAWEEGVAYEATILERCSELRNRVCHVTRLHTSSTGGISEGITDINAFNLYQFISFLPERPLELSRKILENNVPAAIGLKR